jgi:hypothetical protein
MPMVPVVASSTAAADGIARGSFRIVLPPGVRVLLDDVVVREF